MFSTSYSAATKARIEDILEGDFEEVSLGPVSFFKLRSKFGIAQTVTNIRVLGVVSHAFVNDDRTYARLAMEDGTGSITVRTWEENLSLLVDPSSGELYPPGSIVDVVGRVRAYRGEKYVYPNLVIQVKDPNWIIVRNLEILRSSLKKLISYMSTSAEFRTPEGS